MRRDRLCQGGRGVATPCIAPATARVRRDASERARPNPAPRCRPRPPRCAFPAAGHGRVHPRRDKALTDSLGPARGRRRDSITERGRGRLSDTSGARNAPSFGVGRHRQLPRIRVPVERAESPSGYMCMAGTPPCTHAGLRAYALSRRETKNTNQNHRMAVMRVVFAKRNRRTGGSGYGTFKWRAAGRRGLGVGGFEHSPTTDDLHSPLRSVPVILSEGLACIRCRRSRAAHGRLTPFFDLFRDHGYRWRVWANGAGRRRCRSLPCAPKQVAPAQNENGTFSLETAFRLHMDDGAVSANATK